MDPAGRTHLTIHRGVQLNHLTAPMLSARITAGATVNEFIFPAGGVRFSVPPGRLGSVCNSPAVFERLAPGSGFSITLALKRGEILTQRTLTFSAVAP